MSKNIQKIIGNINGHPLDKEQIKAATCRSKYSIIIAGAGSGKSTTMVGKIKYLINRLNINPQDILCISFTNDSCKSLSDNIEKNCNVEVEVLTFHKLAMKILKINNINLTIAKPNMLNFIIDEYFNIPNNKIAINNLISFLKSKYYNKSQKEYDKLITSNDYLNFKKLLMTFITLYNCKYINVDKLKSIYLNSANYKEKAFFTLAIAIYNIYEKEKSSQSIYDFDDLIKASTKIIKNGGDINNYKYIIIDEFQDTSPIRLNLIKEIIQKSNASLTVVGDDFQSIYRFNGCNLNIFLNFTNTFEKAKLLKIEHTYRNSQQLVNVAGSFIMQNNKQIKKNLKSYKQYNKPIKIIFQKDKKHTLKKLLIDLYKSNIKEVLILSRNSFDINDYIDNDYILDCDNIILKGYEDAKIRFLTVHKSKGLEALCVIILNLTNDLLGFPNKMSDHKLLRYLKDDVDNYLYAEERRLFYVALTRTKTSVFLLTEKNNTSIFVKELLKYYHNDIEIIKIR